MLPEVTLRDVSRDDVDRVAWWLEDVELSSRWFGLYGCGDPVHRGYDPRHMLEATSVEWERVFRDPYRLIYSICNEKNEHIGECQVVLDDDGGAELSLLIGRRDHWHVGYGTSTVLTLLDRVFGDFGRQRAWVNVPEDNKSGLGLFAKLGFHTQLSQELYKRPDGSTFNACILSIDANSYRSRQTGILRRQDLLPVVTITGLPGSGSQVIGAAVARMIGSRFLDDEITEEISRRLRRTVGEIQAFEAGYRSYWTRLLNAFALPMEWSGAYEGGHQWFAPRPMLMDYDFFENHMSKKEYLAGLAGVVKSFAAGRSIVLHAHGSNLFVSSKTGSLNVFVSASPELRQRHIADDQRLNFEDAGAELKRMDRHALSISRHLFGSDLLDMGLYDLTLNVDRISLETAAQVVVGALKNMVSSVKPRNDTQVPIAQSSV